MKTKTARKHDYLSKTGDKVSLLARTQEVFFLPNDVSRCDGVGDATQGWRKGCKTCLRRIAPRGEYVSMFLPPPLIASECEYLIKPPDMGGRLSPLPPTSCCAIRCACGCGKQPKKGKRYIRGHNHRGKKAPAEWVEKRAAGIKKAWASGKLDHLREQSEELIEKRIAPLRGRKRPADVVARCAAALKGRKLSDEHKRKCSKRWFTGPQDLSKESEEKRKRSISLQRRGTHGYGRSKRDNPLHAMAKHWIIRDPAGRVHEFDNLQAWCRANEKLFYPDDYPAAKLPLWRRAVSGFNDMQRTDKKGVHAWKGWTLVSVTERETLGAPDLLGRNPHNGGGES